MANSKFYWLKLKRDFFKRTDIKIVEKMPNGKDYILFYLKLLLESVEYEGKLRLSDTIPYNEDMLSTITDTNVDIVRSAMQIFSKLNMIEILDDQTVYMTEIQNMIGSETKWAEKKRQYREKINHKEDNVLALSDKSIELEKELDTEIDKDKDISPKVDISLEKEIYKEREVVEKPKKRKFVPPTLEEVKAYCIEKGLSVNAERFLEYYQAGDWKDAKGNAVKSWKQKLLTWEKRNNDNTPRSISNIRSNSNKTCFGEMMEREGINPKEIIYGKSGDFNFT